MLKMKGGAMTGSATPQSVVRPFVGGLVALTAALLLVLAALPFAYGHFPELFGHFGFYRTCKSLEPGLNGARELANWCSVCLDAAGTRVLRVEIAPD
jgi:hypothetical protein